MTHILSSEAPDLRGGIMSDIIAILVATLAVFGFYCVLAEIRDFLRHRAKKKNNCAKISPISFDKEE
jgi:hypothetical protein